MVFKWFKSQPAPPAPAPEPAVSAVESPCNGVCEMDWVQNICKGCYRTPNEIGAWSQMSDETKRDVVAASEERRPQ